ncbi:hypothetical protein CAPTEDRAFT_214801 [Capitella teleta]|uniref:Uncharacterized protein n=1 Tax=Capitella teleta TaxID=283909 RepID=R7UHM3_CAPTE|nr:hypothetical protein CAPTEDRAFT_214801 [Capitella teleta]|eukprot:ELU05558.1 hypothetical protein CAPTEDRAFT_214801 [Capitella teleta]
MASQALPRTHRYTLPDYTSVYDIILCAVFSKLSLINHSPRPMIFTNANRIEGPRDSRNYLTTKKSYSEGIRASKNDSLAELQGGVFHYIETRWIRNEGPAITSQEVILGGIKRATSNSFCEGLFSIAKKIVRDQRSQLGRGTEVSYRREFADLALTFKVLNELVIVGLNEALVHLYS